MRDLVDLSVIDSKDPHEIVYEIYCWKHDNAVNMAKIAAGIGAGMLLASVAPLFTSRSDVEIQWGWMAATCTSAVAMFLIGVFLFSLARRIHNEYIHAHSLLSDLISMRSFFRQVKRREASREVARE